MTLGEELLGSDLVAGQPVVFDGEDITAGFFGPNALFDALRRGHPGRIRDPTPQHIMVDWVGLEDEPMSFAFGFVNERRSQSDVVGSVRGLRRISEHEYGRRAAMFTGGPPR